MDNTKPKFYVGQQVVITNNTNGHFHEIGEVVELKKANNLVDDYWTMASKDWLFDSDDVEAYETERK